jgi:DNA-binding GntR family transcriptional regulator
MDGEPVALLVGAYPTATARVLTRQAVASTGVYRTLREHGQHPFHADVVLTVSFASAEESLLLEVSEGTPLVCLRCRMRTEAGDLMEVTRELYRSDRFEFSYSAEAGTGGWTQ